MQIEHGSEKTLKGVGQWPGVRGAIVGMTGKGGRRADVDKLRSWRL